MERIGVEGAEQTIRMTEVTPTEPEGQGASTGRTVWESLRELRQQLGFSVDGIAQALDIRPAYVEALERGEIARCLGPGYARSIATRYAVCLGVDAESLVAQLGLPPRKRQSLDTPSNNGRTASDGSLPGSKVNFSVPSRGRVGRRVLLGAMAVGLAALAFMMAVQLGAFGERRNEVSAVPDEAAIVEVSGETPEESTGTTAEVESATADPAAETTSNAGGVSTTTSLDGSFSITLYVSGEVWLEVTEEQGGRTVFTGFRQKGEDLHVTASGPLLLDVGAPENVSTEIDGSSAPNPSGIEWRATADGLEARE